MANKEQTDSYSHILKYTGLFGGVQVLSILVGLIRNKCVAVLLGPGGMGLISLFNSTVNLVSNSTNFGISMSAVRTVSEQFARGDKESVEHAVSVVRLWSLAAAILGTLLCMVCSPLLSWFTFSWNGHILHFLALSPVVGLTAITGGELAILKGMRKMRNLSVISVINLVSSLVISLPIYYFFRISGIVPSLVLMALAQALATIAYSFKVCPPKLNFTRQLFRDGYGMVKLGIAFVVAGIFDSGADLLIRSYLNNVAQIDMVGMYNAGFMLTITYVSLVFSAMETDYFPRLSGVNNLGVTFRSTVSRQIEVMLLLVSPLLVIFMVSLPILIPLLFSHQFMPIIDMVRIVILAMYFRALKLPVQYIPLAKGDSRSYMFLECLSEVMMCIGVVVFFNVDGLTGTGIGLFLSSLCDLVVTYVYARWRYGYRPSKLVLKYFFIQFPIGVLALFATFFLSGFAYWIAGIVLAAVSALYSFHHLRGNFSFLKR